MKIIRIIQQLHAIPTHPWKQFADEPYQHHQRSNIANRNASQIEEQIVFTQRRWHEEQHNTNSEQWQLERVNLYETEWDFIRTSCFQANASLVEWIQAHHTLLRRREPVEWEQRAMRFMRLFHLLWRESTEACEVITVNVNAQHDRLQQIVQGLVAATIAEDVQLLHIVAEAADFRWDFCSRSRLEISNYGENEKIAGSMECKQTNPKLFMEILRCKVEI